MLSIYIFINIIFLSSTLANITKISVQVNDKQRCQFIADIINLNNNQEGWEMILIVGRNIPDEMYSGLKELGTMSTVNIDVKNYDIEEVTNYHPHSIIINCRNFTEFEKAVLILQGHPYWHPPSNIIINYHGNDVNILPLMFFILWYYKASNIIILRHQTRDGLFLISTWSPYITKGFQMDNHFGCSTVEKIDIPISTFNESFVCESDCSDVGEHSGKRINKLGTCVGISTYEVLANDVTALRKLNLFEDKGKDLHGYAMTACAVQVLPFFGFSRNVDGSFTIQHRDAYLWMTISKLMNFTLDFWPVINIDINQFDFETVVKQIVTVAKRQNDLFLLPVYIMDLVIVDMDFTYPYKESGVCILSRRADYETTFFDVRQLSKHPELLAQFLFCNLFLWFGYYIFNVAEKGMNFNEAGKALSNTFRIFLSIPVHSPPKRNTFKILLATSIWGFFIINFNIQASIVSFFTAYKRGKEVDSFEDVIDKGYKLIGVASPDIILPDTEEKFLKINEKMITISNILHCIDDFSNDTSRFCLIECSNALYFERNKLNELGEQYLHVARKDKIHSRYLNMLMQKHSPLTKSYNIYISKLVEAGIIIKWEEYKFNRIKEESLVQPLGIDDLVSVFECFGIFVAGSVTVFFLELLIGYLKQRTNYKLD